MVLDWRYLTTIPDFLVWSACRFRGDLYLGGTWGPHGGLFDRAKYAPLVRVGMGGELQPAWPWQSELRVGPGLGNSVDSLCEWRGDLFASGGQGEGMSTGEWRLARFDGETWTTEDTRRAFEMAAGQDHLYLSWQGGLAVWDGLSAEIAAQIGPGHPESLVLWGGGVAFLATTPGSAQGALALVSREGGRWVTVQGPHPGGVPSTGWTLPYGRRLAAFRGSLWACEWGAGDFSVHLSSYTGSGWQRWAASGRGYPFMLANARNRLVLYESGEGQSSGGSTLYDGTYWQGVFDGTHLESLADCEVVPYRVIGLGDGSAVALCRSRARLEYIREARLTGHVGWDLQWWLPDGDTLVYVTWPEQPGPPMVPAGDLAGTVTDETPAALEAAEVATGDLSDLTDAAGDYGIPDLVVGWHSVVAGRNGYLPEFAEVQIEANAETHQDFALAELGEGDACMYGCVRDGVTGEELFRATVVVDEGTVGEAILTTGPGGSWIFPEAVPGVHTLRASCPGYAPSAERSVTLAIGESLHVDIDLFADGGGSVTGLVRNAVTGSPLRWATVALSREGVTYEALTCYPGHYARAGLPAGTYEATVSCRGYQTRTGRIAVEEGRCTRADWALVPEGVPTGALLVIVAGADIEQSIPGAQVTVLGLASTLTGDDGAALIEDVPSGTYPVLAEAKGYYPVGAVAEVIAPETTGFVLTLDPIPADGQLAWLYGFVRDAEGGEPIAGAEVTLAGDAHPANAGTTITDAAGFFLRTDLWPGTEAASVAASGYQAEALENVPLSAGQGTRLDVALVAEGTPTGVLEGYVFDARDCSLIAQAQVWLDDLQCAYSGRVGEFRFPRVPVGSHALEGTAAGFYPRTIGGVPVEEGQTTHCDLALFRVARLGACVVTVVDQDGATVAGAQVALNPWIAGVTGSEGTVRLEHVPEGIYDVLACKDWYLPGHTPVQVRAGGVATVTVTITRQLEGDLDGVLVGYVCDEYTRGGIKGATVEAAGSQTRAATSTASGYYALALPADTYDVTGAADLYRSRVYADVVVASRRAKRLDLFLVPGLGEGGSYFVGVPQMCEAQADETGVPLGGAGEVCVEWPEDESSWEVAIAVDEVAGSAAGLFRRGQRVVRAKRTALEKQGSQVRIVARRTSGELTGIAAQFWPV